MADDVGQWLQANGFADYAAAFAANKVDLVVLPHLTAEDLKEIGIDTVGERRRLLLAIAEHAAASQQAAAVPPAAARPDRAERRQLTVLFSDLVGSTALSTELDPEDLRLIIRRYQDAVSGAITRYGGHVAQYLGDGVLAYFGWPQAYEDQSERAVRAGLEVVGSVARLQLEGGEKLQARVGIATGRVVVGDLLREGNRNTEAVTGQTPNLAARLQNIARPGELVVAELTHRMLGGGFDVTDLGRLDLKGFGAPVQAYQVNGERASESRFEAAHEPGVTQLFGRDEELARLRSCWEQAFAGQGQVVFVRGEPGIGKSRLLQALRDDVAGQSPIRLRYQCSPYFSNSALYPVVRQLEHAAGFLADDSGEAKLDKLEAMLVGDSGHGVERLKLFASLMQLPYRQRYGELELSPLQRKEQIFEALIDELLALGRRRPVLSLFEDAHWIDPTTQEVMARALERLDGAKVLLLVSHRPEWQAPFLDEARTVHLDRLSAEAAGAIVRAIAGRGVSKAFVDRIAARSDGVPLYAEELTKAGLEGGDAAADVPTTLQASLAARLDNLGEAKAVAQAAAVIGREFGYVLLSQVVDDAGPALDEALARLVAAELVNVRGQPPEATYAFKHALLQDAAYESLLRQTRQKYHQRIARVLEYSLPDDSEGRAELLAHHFSCAGLAEEAAVFWQQAADRAVLRSAHVEALNHIDSGLAALQSLSPGRWRDELELALQTRRGTALRAVSGYAAPQVMQAYERARTLCEALGETPQLFPVIWGQLLSHFVRADVEAAHALAEELAELAAGRRDHDLQLEAEGALGMTQLHLGEMTAAREHLEAGVALYDPRRHRAHALIYGQDPGVFCLSYLAWGLWFLGHPAQALARIEQALALARDAAHPYSLVFVLMFATRVHQGRRDDAAVLQAADQMIAIAGEQGFSYYQAQGAIQQGSALIGLGRIDEGVARMHAGMAALQATGTELGRPGTLMRLAEGYAVAGQHDDALELLAEATALAESGTMRLWDAELARLRGQFLLACSADNLGEAEAAFERAVAIARRQQARSLELRACTSLARLRCDDDRSAAARDVLAPVVTWFEDGEETVDLLEARAELARLQ